MNRRRSLHSWLSAGLLAVAVATLSPLTARAQGYEQRLSDVVEVELLPGWRIAEGRHMAGLRIALAPGWKTYWRAPGDAGIPPRLRVENVDGLGPVQLHWPRPEVFYANGMRSIGYRGDVILPVEVETPAGVALRLAGEIDLGVCQDVCLPVSLPFATLLAPGGTPDARIVAALDARATPAAETATCRVTPIADGMRIEAEMPVSALGEEEVAVFELALPGVWISQAVTERRNGRIVAAADIVPPEAQPFPLARGDVTITVIGSRQAVEFHGCRG